MLYPELFKSLEAVRWNMESDVPWAKFDATRLSEEQARTIKMNAITEWSALPATEMFLRDNAHDSDFSAFMSVWFFEEQKHSLVLLEYLRRFCPQMMPTEAELHAVRFTFDPAPAIRTESPAETEPATAVPVTINPAPVMLKQRSTASRKFPAVVFGRHAHASAIR